MDTTSNLEYVPGANYDPAYYRDEVKCFVPSCKKYRRDHPNVNFFSIPKELKDIWCQAIQRNCPKRPVHVCEEHINVEQDCFKTKNGRLRLKSTANLSLTEPYCENLATMEIAEAEVTVMNEPIASYPKRDSASQCRTDSANKAVLAKPVVRSVGCAVNMKAANISYKIVPSLPQEFSSSITSGSSTPSMFEISSPSRSSTSSYKENIPEKNISGRNHMMCLIKENPKMYIGVPKQYYWLVDFLAKQCKLRPLHIIIILFKIKQNDTVKRISDHFNLSQVTIIEIFKVSMHHLASYLQNCIYLPQPIEIKKTLPLVFKARYANIQCIIDCFEIEIEKPSDPIQQTSTWSQYKSCNTIKYLIACCPNGFICFVSQGYGGRISDKAITERSGFVDILPPGAVVLADRGFKGIDTLLRDRKVILLRPPTVSSKETPTKKEVLQSKIIASLRIHVERLIRRVREFRFLKPHSVINHSHIKYLDNSVIIACSLANLQGDLIKIQ